MPGEHQGGHYAPGAGGQPAQWRKSESGHLVMPEKQSQYLDWYLEHPTSRSPGTLEEWCEWYEVGLNTVKGWHKDPRFKEEHRKRLYERAIDPQQLQPVLDAMHTAASGLADPQAIRQYMTLIERLAPQDPINRDPEVQSMSDEEIVAELRELLADEA
jgi:hypothetical protein